jgi:hypothetical protein
MNEQTFRVIMYVAGVLLSIIGFFIVRYVNRTSKKQDENSKSIIDTHLQLSESINKLQLAITGLNGVILSMQQSSDTFSKGCQDKHNTINKRLDEHGKFIDDHRERIVRIETKVGIE